jgi:hypothetical protein
MNFKSFYLSETPHFSDVEPNSSNFTLHGRYNNSKNKKFKELKHDKFKILQTTSHSKNSLEWFVFLDGVLVANISSEDGLDSKFKFPQITLTIVSPEFRNQHIASDFYNFLIQKYGGIISSKFLSKTGGMLLWKSLIKKYNSYEYDESKKLNPIKEIPAFGDSSTRLIISKKELS